MSEELTLTQRILVRASELVSNPSAWIKRSCFGQKVSKDGMMADLEKYCALGAIYRASSELTGSPINVDGAFHRQPWYVAACPVIDKVAQQIEPHGSVHEVHRFNDRPSTTHEQVKDIFCKAVKEELNGTGTDTGTEGAGASDGTDQG